MIRESVCIYFCIHNTISIWRVTPPTVKKSNSLVTFVFHAWYCICADEHARQYSHSLTRSHTRRDCMPITVEFLFYLTSIYTQDEVKETRREWCVISPQRSVQLNTPQLYYTHSFRSFVRSNEQIKFPSDIFFSLVSDPKILFGLNFFCLFNFLFLIFHRKKR